MRKTRVVEDVIDDLTGEHLMEGDGVTVVFGWDGEWLEIDLASQIARTFRELVQPYANAARLYTPNPDVEPPILRQTERRNHHEEASRARRNKAIREWAPFNGFDLPARGRIPDDVRLAWEQAVEANGGEWPEVRRRQPVFAPSTD